MGPRRRVDQAEVTHRAHEGPKGMRTQKTLEAGWDWSGERGSRALEGGEFVMATYERPRG
jgi:hypothetical protein